MGESSPLLCDLTY